MPNGFFQCCRRQLEEEFLRGAEDLSMRRTRCRPDSLAAAVAVYRLREVEDEEPMDEELEWLWRLGAVDAKG